MEPIDVRDLLDAPGATRAVERSEALEGMSGELARADEPVDMRLRLDSVVEGIFVSGEVRTQLSFSCARCLKDGRSDLRIEVAELFADDGRDDDDAYLIEDGALDPEPMVRDAIVLAIPFSPLCRPDCLGLCERCGGDRNLGECSCAGEVDPRWAVLGALEID